MFKVVHDGSGEAEFGWWEPALIRWLRLGDQLLEWGRQRHVASIRAFLRAAARELLLQGRLRLQ